MNAHMFLQLFLVSVCLISVEAQNLTFEVQPQSLNVSINQEARFSCSVYDAYQIVWIQCPSSTQNEYCNDIKNLDTTGSGTEINILTQSHNSPFSSYLNITIRDDLHLIDELNDSLLYCAALPPEAGVPSYSLKARLLFQGVVDPPGNVITNITCKEDLEALNIKWDRPSTLIGVDIISYNVRFEEICYDTNGNDSNLAVKLPRTNSSSCESQFLCVEASTLAGFSDASCIDVILLKGPPFLPLQGITSELIFAPEAQSFKILCTILDELYCGISVNFSAVLVYGGKNVTINGTSYNQANETNIQNMVSFTIPSEIQEIFVTVVLMMVNCAGSNYSDPIEIGLFHVQNLTVDENLMEITCTFAELSNAWGCRIVVICSENLNNSDIMEQNVICNFFINKTDSNKASRIVPAECFLNQSCSAMDIYAYDVHKDGSISMDVAKSIRNIPYIIPSWPTGFTSVLDLSMSVTPSPDTPDNNNGLYGLFAILPISIAAIVALVITLILLYRRNKWYNESLKRNIDSYELHTSTKEN